MRRLLISLALIALPLTDPAPVLAQTAEEDRSFLQGLLEDNLSGAGREVRIVGFAGALSARASIEELTIADQTASGCGWRMWFWTGTARPCCAGGSR